MSLLATCWWTLIRTVVLCLVALPLCRCIEQCLDRLPAARRNTLLVLLLAPCCFPELLVGYAFRDMALAHPAWAETLCSVLLLVRIVPVGAIALLAAPASPQAASAVFCRRLLLGNGPSFAVQGLELVRCYWHAHIVRMLPAMALMGIVAFQEFELAALLQTMSWTDWFVVAERLGLDRAEMMQKALWPLGMQAPLLLGIVVWLRRRSGVAGRRDTDFGAVATRGTIWPGLLYVILALVVGFLVPMGMIGWRTVEGFGGLVRTGPQLRGLFQEIATAGAISICAGMSAWGISRFLKGFATHWLLPGLAGSLLLSLAVVALFQWTWLHPLYDSPVPWTFALTIWLLPRAAVLRLWLRAFQDDEAIHVAEMLAGVPGHQARRLLWRLRDQSQFLSAGLLCCWAYCDLPTAYLLAPTGMASGLVRLYNFMHFGRSAALSAEASLFFGIPVACLFLLMFVNRSWR